jgi:formylglycine-generating enzyme required for sulfatase activity
MSFRANEFGLFDLSGNASEWVEDTWDAASSAHVLRGGSWTFNNRPILLSSWRGSFGATGQRGTNVGFRVVLAK